MPSWSRAHLLAACSVLLWSGVLHAQPAPTSVRRGIDLAGMDRTVQPGDDFYRFANGAWSRSVTIPADRSSWSDGSILYDQVNVRIAGLVEQAKTSVVPNERKIADYYTAYIDTAGIDAKGLSPLTPELKRIAAISDVSSLSAYLGSTVRADVDMLNDTHNQTRNIMGLWIAADLDQPTHYTAFLVQGGLSLPSRDYYLDSSASMAVKRAALQAHAAKVLELAGVEEAPARAAEVVTLETAIARAHASSVDLEDPQKGDNHWSRTDFQTHAPGLDWSAFLAAGGLGRRSDFTVWTPGAIAGESALVASTPVATWKAYLTLHLVDSYSAVLPKPFRDERFAFYGHELSGAEAPSSRVRQAVEADSSALGEEIGRLYVTKYFPPERKAAVQAIVADIKAAFGRRIDALSWMAPATKREARAKLDTLVVGVGYPDKWWDYTGLEIRPDDAFGNSWRARLFDTRRRLSWLDKPVDRTEWVMTPQTVNSVNLPVLNALNFPAGWLQPPMFDPTQTAAMNYGSIGAIIGHEISHSFDNSGALFDSHGRLRNWWTAADLAHFQAAGRALVSQYDAYCPLRDLCVRGEQTLSENIADLAGLAAAYDAWRASLHGRAAPSAEGLTGEQQFFLSFAQTWREVEREALLRELILTDGHAPDRYRALTVRNLDAWYPAFGVRPGQALSLPSAERVRVW